MSSVYHEQQTGSSTHCALHSANNLLGRPEFTLQHFLTLKKQLAIDDELGLCSCCLHSLPPCCCHRCRQDEGNFDANILTVALAQHNIELSWWDARNKDEKAVLGALQSENCLGVLINQQAGFDNGCVVSCLLKVLSLCFGKNGHWVALRKIDNQHFVDLNSSRNLQTVYGSKDVLTFLAQHLNNGSHLLLAHRRTE